MSEPLQWGVGKDAPTACSEPQSRDMFLEPDSQRPPAGGHSTGIPSSRSATQNPHGTAQTNPGIPGNPPGAIPIPRTSSRQQPPHQNLLSTGQGAAAQRLWDIAAGTRTCWGRAKQKEIQACLCRKHIFPASGLVPEQVLECRAACQAQTPAWEAEKVHGTREVSNQTFLAQGSRAVPTEPFQTSSSAKQVCSVNFADAEAGQSY